MLSPREGSSTVTFQNHHWRRGLIDLYSDGEGEMTHDFVTQLCAHFPSLEALHTDCVLTHDDLRTIMAGLAQAAHTAHAVALFA